MLKLKIYTCNTVVGQVYVYKPHQSSTQNNPKPSSSGSLSAFLRSTADPPAFSLQPQQGIPALALYWSWYLMKSPQGVVPKPFSSTKSLTHSVLLFWVYGMEIHCMIDCHCSHPYHFQTLQQTSSDKPTIHYLLRTSRQAKLENCEISSRYFFSKKPVITLTTPIFV